MPSTLGSWTISLIGLAFLSCLPRPAFWRHVLVVGVVLVIVSGVNRTVKRAVSRERPAKAFQEQIEPTLEILLDALHAPMRTEWIS